MSTIQIIATSIALGLTGGCSQEVGPAPAREPLQDHPSPIFEFRGYNEYSDCSEIVSAEERLGSQVTSVEIADDSVSPDIHITAMTVDMYGVQMEAEVRCGLDGDLLHAAYWVNGDDEEVSRANFQTISAGLSESYGQPKEVEQEGGNSHTFVCDELAELYLAHVFRPLPGDPYSVFLTVDLLSGECMLP